MSENQIRIEDLTPHVLQRSLVLEEARLLYVPTPKAACTSMMWALADLAGLTADHFLQSPSFEPTAELTIHDMDRWPDEHRLDRLAAERQTRALNENGWLRFTLVRDPVRRLWSAWQSKVLVREPSFIRRYANRSWFPTEPPEPGQIVARYRAFLAAVDAGIVPGDPPTLDDVADNPHWRPQSALLGGSGMRLFRIGRLENLGDMLAALEKHLANRGLLGLHLRSAKAFSIPYHPALLGSAGRSTVARLYAADLDQFGYRVPAAEEVQSDLGAWAELAAQMIPAVEVAIEHNLRFDALQGLTTHQTAELSRTAASLARLRNERNALRRELNDRSQRIERLQNRITELNEAAAEARRAAERAVRGVEEQLAIARAGCRLADSRALDASLQAAEAERTLDGITSTLWWRLGAPFRSRRNRGERQ